MLFHRDLNHFINPGNLCSVDRTGHILTCKVTQSLYMKEITRLYSKATIMAISKLIVFLISMLIIFVTICYMALCIHIIFCDDHCMANINTHAISLFWRLYWICFALTYYIGFCYIIIAHLVPSICDCYNQCYFEQYDICYGSLFMQSMDIDHQHIVYEHELKILENVGNVNISFGLIDTVNGNYCYSKTGFFLEYDRRSIPNGQILSCVYIPNKATIQFKINDTVCGTVQYVHGNVDLKYRLFVKCGFKQHGSIKLQLF